MGPHFSSPPKKNIFYIQIFCPFPSPFFFSVVKKYFPSPNIFLIFLPHFSSPPKKYFLSPNISSFSISVFLLLPKQKTFLNFPPSFSYSIFLLLPIFLLLQKKNIFYIQIFCPFPSPFFFYS